MKTPTYIGITKARQVLAEIGVELTPRQIKRAADPDANGKRKLPFFIDPIDGRLKIEEGTLREIYLRCQVAAENSSHINSTGLKNSFDQIR